VSECLLLTQNSEQSKVHLKRKKSNTTFHSMSHQWSMINGQCMTITQKTSVKSSVGIITHQSHISKVSICTLTDSLTDWRTSPLERLVTLTKKQTEDLMLSGPLTPTENYNLKWEMLWQDNAPTYWSLHIYRFVQTFVWSKSIEVLNVYSQIYAWNHGYRVLQWWKFGTERHPEV